MANYGGQNYTTFSGVNIKGTSAIRFAVPDSGFDSTLSIAQSLDAARAWRFPDKSGTFPVTGTFSVQMPAIAAGAFSETAVTVTGIRAEDVAVVTLQNTFQTVTTSRGMATLIGARPQNGYFYLTFFNFGSSATIAESALVCAYAVAR